MSKYLTGKELAEELGVAIRTVEGWRYGKKGGPPFHKLGACVKYLRSDVAAWLRGCRVVVDKTDDGGS